MAARASAGRTRGSILEEATRLFGEQGYTGTTMRDIASAVGVLPGSLYTHIDGKETLLMEIVEAGIDSFLALSKAAMSGPGGADERLRQLVRGHVSIVAQNPERTLVVFHQWRYLTGENRRRVVEKRRQYEADIRSVMTDGRASGVFDPKLDLKVSVLGLLGALNWTAEWYKPDGPDTGAEIGERLADALLRGLLGE
ncbi:TetR/AcrR family transcriptional regulator [Amycolatopsis sp.]|uniref:TetR/AcrR family transcriptional regulator n=1 Tax=Amycolatopsis sp. TaxID=37632 RepID=UPI002BF6D8A6|nr:TetR/AcrR family transcriptional regulator [Amycolatopsis sp.]HVV08248.1 TetR/AcrR family transcriptional regulator [Amycolatopsis sp.]